MRIDSLSHYPKRDRGDYFSDVGPAVWHRAKEWLAKFRERWGWKLPNWRLGILVGQARRLALNPSDSAWGRSMLAARGGHALQRRRREEKQYQGQKAALGVAAQPSSRNAVPAGVNSKEKRLRNDRRRQVPPLDPVPLDSGQATDRHTFAFACGSPIAQTARPSVVPVPLLRLAPSRALEEGESGFGNLGLGGPFVRGDLEDYASYESEAACRIDRRRTYNASCPHRQLGATGSQAPPWTA